MRALQGSFPEVTIQSTSVVVGPKMHSYYNFQPSVQVVNSILHHLHKHLKYLVHH